MLRRGHPERKQDGSFGRAQQQPMRPFVIYLAVQTFTPIRILVLMLGESMRDVGPVEIVNG